MRLMEKFGIVLMPIDMILKSKGFIKKCSQMA